MVRKILVGIPEAVLREDLARYKEMALEMGAKDSMVIPTSIIPIDERARAKCKLPLCNFYSTNINCPPYGMSVEESRALVRKYEHAVLFKLEIEPELMVGEDAAKRRLHIPSAMKINKISAAIESAAFYDGYHFALAFGCGPCKASYCPDEDCQALQLGKSCKHALKARGSADGAGIDLFRLAAQVGWDVYPAGRCLQPSDIPHASRIGLVLVA